MSHRWRTGGVALCLGLGLHGAASAQGDTTAVRPGGFYTAEQGARGADVYTGQCVRCHSIADHSGPDFKLAWHGQSVRALYDYLRGTMPDDDPGRLTEQQYLDVTAYLLKVNGMPAGDVALVADTTALKRLVIDIKSSAGAPSPNETLPGRSRRLFR
jgi:mono/diheme cytochrome c family protein